MVRGAVTEFIVFTFGIHETRRNPNAQVKRVRSNDIKGEGEAWKMRREKELPTVYAIDDTKIPVRTHHEW